VHRLDEFVELVRIPAIDGMRLEKTEDANGTLARHASASSLPMLMFPRNFPADFECAPLRLCRLL
jgi:hypothetical protein